MSFVTKVTRNAAMHPVARAIAKQKLKSKITDQRIKLFMLKDGDDVLSDALEMNLVIHAILLCLGTTEPESPEYRKLRSAAKVLLEIAETKFKWRTSHAVTLDNALDICETKWHKIPPDMLNAAINDLLAQEINQ
jgi:hypothetical protein